MEEERQAKIQQDGDEEDMDISDIKKSDAYTVADITAGLEKQMNIGKKKKTINISNDIAM